MTKSLIILLGILLPLAALASPVAPVSASAKKRAALYQAEVRATLIKESWHVAGESPGILVADHTLLDQEASPNAPNGHSGYTRVVVQFKPKSETVTDCTASVLNYVDGYYLAANVKKYHGHPPTPSDPATVKLIENIINSARKKLVDVQPSEEPARAQR